MIDFSRAFDVVDHPVLLAKLSELDLPECIKKTGLSLFLLAAVSLLKLIVFLSAAHQQRYSSGIWCGTRAVYCGGRRLAHAFS